MVCLIDSDNAMNSLNPSDTTRKIYFKINLLNRGKISVIIVADLKQISDIETAVYKRHPELKSEKLTIYYFDENRSRQPIGNSDEFNTFIAKHISIDIYVSLEHGHVMVKNERIQKKIEIKDLISLVAFVFYCLFVLSAILYMVLQHQDSNSEERLDQWTEYKKIIQEFCNTQPGLKECQGVIRDFLSFMSFDSLAHPRA